eukprot:11163361-Lingulodinium_polyedra.AAC.1
MTAERKGAPVGGQQRNSRQLARPPAWLRNKFPRCFGGKSLGSCVPTKIGRRSVQARSNGATGG